MKLSKAELNLIEPNIRCRIESLEENDEAHDRPYVRKLKKLLAKIHEAQEVPAPAKAQPVLKLGGKMVEVRAGRQLGTRQLIIIKIINLNPDEKADYRDTDIIYRFADDPETMKRKGWVHTFKTGEKYITWQAGKFYYLSNALNAANFGV